MINVTFTISAPTLDVEGNPLDQSLIASYDIFRVSADGIIDRAIVLNTQSLTVSIGVDAVVDTYYAALANTTDGRDSALSNIVMVPAAPVLPPMPSAPSLSVV